ncbi:MAG TPA: DUF2764 family protein [bacterium]|nr:DUF2764 family protein [bacterium]
MDKYYYLVAQLPSLVFDRENPISVQTFLEEAEKWLSVSDFRALKQARLDDPENRSGGPGVWRRYGEFESRFRRELGQWRQALRDGSETRPDTFSPSLVKEGNPLEVEKKLLARRWEVIAEEEKDHHFDLGFLVLYYLKLQILQRLSVFDKEKGMEHFQTMSRVTV